MIINALLPFLAGIASCVLGLVVVFSGKSDQARFSFFVFAFSMGIWAILISTFLISSNLIWTHILAVGYYIAAILLIYGFYLYCMSLQHDSAKRRSGWKSFLSGVPVILITTAVISGGVIGQISTGMPHEVPLQPVGYLLYCVTFAAYSVAAFMSLINAIKKEKVGLHRSQYLIIVQVMCICLPCGAFFNLILPLVGNYHLIMIGPIFALPVVGAVFYAIMRHRLFDIRSAVVRSVAYFMVLATMVGLYFSLAFLVSNLFHRSSSDPVGLSLNMTIAIILALIFQPAKHFFDRLTNRIFYREDYSTDDFFARINHELTTTTDLRSLLQRAATEISAMVKAEQGFFFVRYGENRFTMTGTKYHKRIALADIALLDTYVRAGHPEALLADLLPEAHPLSEVLNRNTLAVTLPLKLSDGSLGYLFLGAPRSRNYSRRDMRLLETISDELVIAIQNALSIQDVEEINLTLQQRIEDATKELRRSNAQLQRLDTAKDEFISMASHQLRTPLTSVKGYISMVLEGDVGEITDMQHKLLEEAFLSSERMVHLINDFLNVSRLQTGKFMIERRPIDLAKITAQEVDSLQTIAKSHDLKLKFKASSRIPILYIDESKIRQVIMNFIDNAIYYSREFTTITVELTLNGGDVMLQVHDTGIGVPIAEQAHLFTKFFRATNARKQRPDGTGVGLFLAKKVIVAHGGHILFTSVEGKGSSFGFRLPIKKLQSAPADEMDNLQHQ